jgi:hypothetical protein
MFERWRRHAREGRTGGPHDVRDPETELDTEGGPGWPANRHGGASRAAEFERDRRRREG